MWNVSYGFHKPCVFQTIQSVMQNHILDCIIPCAKLYYIEM